MQTMLMAELVEEGEVEDAKLLVKMRHGVGRRTDFGLEPLINIQWDFNR